MKNNINNQYISTIKKRNTYRKDFKKNWGLYTFLIPGIIVVLIFNYTPMGGLIIAFKDYNIFSGTGPVNAMFQSDWVGLKHFERLFIDREFWSVLNNTLIISSLKLLFVFPTPIILAVLLNEVRNTFFQKKIQTILYLPHFMSWVIVSGIFFQLLGVYGPLNGFLMKVGMLKNEIPFLQSPGWYRPLLVSTDIWKTIGWSSIIYLASITGIEPQLYEAAQIDGANKWQQIKYITLPGISTTIALLFILAVGGILDAGFDQVFNTYSVYVYGVGDIIGTYVYRMGLGKLQYSFSTAVGLFNSVVAFIMIMGGNYISRKYFKKGIW